MLERIRLEVAAMNKMLDALYSWQRTCPICGAFLEKTEAREPWKCKCGWEE